MSDFKYKFVPQNDRQKELFKLIKTDLMPCHTAIIMDGNGRWAKQKGLLSRIAGHKEGTKSVRRIVTASAELGMTALTLYAFSMENWNRPKNEVKTLMAYLEDYLINERPTLKENNISLIASGRLNMLPEKTQKILFETIKLTEKNTGLKLNLALSYGGRTEIIDAAQKLFEKIKNGEISENNITEENFSSCMYHPEIPDPDLMIRTSGEYRVSNFLLWEIAYAEIFITPVLWPDFTVECLLEAVVDYQKRERRFGRVSPLEKK